MTLADMVQSRIARIQGKPVPVYKGPNGREYVRIQDESGEVIISLVGLRYANSWPLPEEIEQEGRRIFREHSGERALYELVKATANYLGVEGK